MAARRAGQVGRPSKAPQRRAQILRAVTAVAARYGLTGATLDRIAEAAGLERSLILHYFGARDSLIQAYVTQAVAGYGDATLQAHRDRPLPERVALMFGPDPFRAPADQAVWLDLVALAARDDTARERMRTLWADRWLPDLERQLAAEFPDAPEAAVAAVAYGLTCLFEAHWAFAAQGVDDPLRREQAVRAAHAVLGTLGAAGS